MAVTNKIKLRVIELRAEGNSYAKIAEALKIAKQTAVDIVKENEDEVASLQAVEMEAVFEAEQVNLRGRVEQLATLQAKLRKEIESRDLSDVPTDKLITLLIKTNQALREEVYTPEATSSSEQERAANRRHLLGGW
jgi:hypothetical protein